MYGLKTESSFDAAHFLTDYHGKCENLHGHRWRVVAYLEQENLQTEGTMKDMVLDFGEFKQAVRAMTRGARPHLHRGRRFALAADYRVLGGRRLHALFPCRFAPPAENLARYFFDHLREQGLPIAQIDVYETPNNCAIYRG